MVCEESCISNLMSEKGAFICFIFPFQAQNYVMCYVSTSVPISALLDGVGSCRRLQPHYLGRVYNCRGYHTPRGHVQ